MEKNYKKLIETIRDYFPRGKERIILNINLHTQKWTLCDANYGSAVDISQAFATQLTEELKFNIHRVDEYFICMKSELIGDELRRYLQNK
jgi:hypothetical protein